MLGLYLLFIFIGAALVTPWIWRTVQTLLPSSALAHYPFHRYVNRALLVLAIAGLWPLVRLRFFPGFFEAGFKRSRTMYRDLIRGSTLGFISLALFVFWVIVAGNREWVPHHQLKQILLHILQSVGAAVVVGVLEELLFRGVVFGVLRRSYGFLFSGVLSSVLYAMVHFFLKPAAPASVGAWTGFEMLVRMASGFADLSALLPSFLNLTLAGFVLSALRERTGALWMSIGLHGGWIFWLKSYAFLTQPRPSTFVSFWGSSALIDGWFAFACLWIGIIGISWVSPFRMVPKLDKSEAVYVR